MTPAVRLERKGRRIATVRDHSGALSAHSIPCGRRTTRPCPSAQRPHIHLPGSPGRCQPASIAVSVRKMTSTPPQVLVVGAGVSGLTTGVCLAEQGLRVLIQAERAPGDSSSAAAGAIWDPIYAEHPRVEEWAA